MVFMQVVMGVVALVVKGAAVVIAITWLTNRRWPPATVAGVTLAIAAAAWCGFAVFALIADNGIGANLRLGGALAIAVFTLTAAVSLLAARRGCRR
jgi:hypothetical protein